MGGLSNLYGYSSAHLEQRSNKNVVEYRTPFQNKLLDEFHLYREQNPEKDSLLEAESKMRYLARRGSRAMSTSSGLALLESTSRQRKVSIDLEKTPSLKFSDQRRNS